jgi:type I restriction-modification system DNA methylase subunit
MNASIVADYLAKITTLYKTGQTTEHSFRPALQDLFNAINPEVQAVNEPKGIKVGRPDFVFLRQVGASTLTVGHCEAKDLKFGIDPKELKDANKEQFNRYTKALPNLIYTNGVDFDFYKNGERVRQISIADFVLGIQDRPDQFAVLANQLKDFAAERLQTVTSPEQLAELMAGKAVLIKDVLFNSLKEDADFRTELAGQYQAFKDQLIHDLTLPDFADLYAETIAYGLFGARLHDETLATFTRTEALALLPKSNPFLRQLFVYVAGPNLEEGIARTIDELAEIFQATNLPKLFENFGTFTQRNDPFIHFYETFLAKYNPAKRKARGVWYTPEPVVNFIVRAVDDVLKSEFGLADGLADTSKIVVDWDTGQNDAKGKPRIEKREMHRVQILDPAAGTGTFLAEVIKQIAPKVKDVAPGQWNKYVEEELIPRLHGFELLMASYAMCHMKLDMMLTKMGYKPTDKAPRLGVYLTNTLEKGVREVRDLFMAKWLSDEAAQANKVKRNVPVMCVIGNPPYSGESTNKGKGFEWIEGLMQAYKKEPGGQEKLKERNPKWINDDYVKFIRLAEHMIAENGEGVLGFITNHGYLDNPTFRGMRWHLLNTFDKIWVLDLHGNSKKKEVCPDGSPDTNVFDIMQGVAIIIGVKKQGKVGAKKELAQVMHGDLWGTRKEKYDALWDEMSTWTTVELTKPYLALKGVLSPLADVYNEGIEIQKLFKSGQLGFQTHRDAFAVAERANILIDRLAQIIKKDGDLAAFERDQNLRVSTSWNLQRAKNELSASTDLAAVVQECWYRPFDKRYYITHPTINDRPRADLNKHVIGRANLQLCISRQLAFDGYRHVLASNLPAESCLVSNKTKEGNVNFPLYQFEDLDQTRRVNMDPKIRGQIEDKAEHPTIGRPDEVAIFDYIYGVLHCPAYRSTYAEFLKIDFPRVPWPTSPDAFWDISAKGSQLRALHLMEDSAIGATPYKFLGDGDSMVEKSEYAQGNVYINKTQYFEGVPPVAWSFYIGGYQPAQKWLKDRKGRNLSFEDIKHYQKIIKILSETDRIMATIEMEL